jgi:hypothetical protein
MHVTRDLLLKPVRALVKPEGRATLKDFIQPSEQKEVGLVQGALTIPERAVSNTDRTCAFRLDHAVAVVAIGALMICRWWRKDRAHGALQRATVPPAAPKLQRAIASATDALRNRSSVEVLTGYRLQDLLGQRSLRGILRHHVVQIELHARYLGCPVLALGFRRGSQHLLQKLADFLGTLTQHLHLLKALEHLVPMLRWELVEEVTKNMFGPLANRPATQGLQRG